MGISMQIMYVDYLGHTYCTYGYKLTVPTCLGGNWGNTDPEMLVHNTHYYCNHDHVPLISLGEFIYCMEYVRVLEYIIQDPS